MGYPSDLKDKEWESFITDAEVKGIGQKMINVLVKVSRIKTGRNPVTILLNDKA